MNSNRAYSKCDIILLRLILTIFKILGVAPFTVNISVDNRKTLKQSNLLYFSTSITGSLYNVTLSLCLLLVIYFLTPIILNLEQSKIGIMFTTSLFIGCNIMVITILLIYVIRQRDIVKIANQLVNLNTKLIAILLYDDVDNKPNNSKFYYTSTIIIYGMSFTLLLTTQVIGTSIFAITLIPQFLLVWSTIQYALIVKYLQQLFKVVNKSLNLLENCAFERENLVINLAPNLMRHKIMKDLCDIRKAHRILYDISRQVSEFYSLPSLLVSTYACTGTMYSSYHFVISFFRDTVQLSYVRFFNSVFWIVQPILPTIILADSVNGHITEVSINLLS